MKKKVCFLVDSIFTIGGVQRVTAVIAKALSDEYDVTILTLDNPSLKNTKLYNLDEKRINYQFFSYPHIGTIKKNLCRIISGLYIKLRPQSRWCSNIYAHSSFIREQKKVLLSNLLLGNYDIIIGVHAPLACRLASLRKELPNAKLIGWIHNSYDALFSKGSNYIGPERKRHYIYQFRTLDKTIVLSEYDANLYRTYDNHFNPIVIYNPLTLNPGSISEGISHHFLAVGRFTHQHKGFDLLIKAFNIFAQINKEWALDIVGEGPEESLLRELIVKYRLEKRVKIHPFTNDIQSYYSSAQFYVLSSRWEGFGLVLVEAMAHGLPVISSDLPTSKEIMGDFGLYFTNGDTAELAQRLEDATHIDWPAKSQEAMKIAQQFSVGKIIGQWKSLIEQ